MPDRDSMPKPIDILMVSPGTTAGWRQADRGLAEALRSAGIEVAVADSEFRIARHLRRGMLMTDLAEATAMRRATDGALRRFDPKAIVFSSTQAAMLQPRGRLAKAAVRFDAPAALNRRGAGARLLHRIERRSLGHAKLLLPYGLQPNPQLAAAIRSNAPMVALPAPIAGVAAAGQREPIAIAYAGNPAKKGLDTIVAAWGKARPKQLRLVVTGIDAGEGRAFLRERGVGEPAGIEWAGLVSPERFRELLSHAELYLSASRFEDYGQAQLEALASGALLVTTPSAGPYEARVIARVLEPRLVNDDLAAAIAAAIAMPSAERDAYRAGARERTRDYSAEELGRRLREQVLPLLLG